MSSNNQDSNHEFRSLYPALDEDELARKSNAYLGNTGVSYRKELIVRSEGRSIWTASGHKFLDWTSGQMSCLLGHGHPEIVKVVAEHAAKLDHLSRECFHLLL